MPVGFDKVTICNMALSHVGSKSPIEDINEPNTPAKQCKLWYNAARLATLEVHNWGFARKSQVLATHSVAAPTLRWAFRYQYPSDCVAPRLIENPGGLEADAVAFEIEEADANTQCILTDQEEAVLLYTRDLELVSRFSLHFTLMVSLRLGLFINSKLTGKVGIEDRLQRRFNDMLIQAPVVDTSGHVSRKTRDPLWIRARA